MGHIICEPVISKVVATLRDNQIDVLIIDPFISSHHVAENDNSAIGLVAKKWSQIAEEANCAILLDIPRLAQFAGLERRTFSTGRDRVDHGRTGHDDAANAAAGALTLAASRVEQIIPIVAPLTWSANRGWDDTPTPNNNGIPAHYLKVNQPVDPGVAYAGAPSRGSHWGPI